MTLDNVCCSQIRIPPQLVGTKPFKMVSTGVRKASSRNLQDGKKHMHISTQLELAQFVRIYLVGAYCRVRVFQIACVSL